MAMATILADFALWPHTQPAYVSAWSIRAPIASHVCGVFQEFRI